MAILIATLAVAALLLAACRRGGESGDSGEQGESMATPAVAAQVPAKATAASPILLAQFTAPDAASGSGNAAWAMVRLPNATTQWATLTSASSARATSQTRRLVDDLGASLDAGTPISQLHNLLAGTVSVRSADRNAELPR